MRLILFDLTQSCEPVVATGDQDALVVEIRGGEGTTSSAQWTYTRPHVVLHIELLAMRKKLAVDTVVASDGINELVQVDGSVLFSELLHGSALDQRWVLVVEVPADGA